MQTTYAHVLSNTIYCLPFVHSCFLFFHKLGDKVWLFSVQFEHWILSGKIQVGILAVYN